MSDVETVINASKQIEKMLELRLGASGRGLHDKVSSVQARLPEFIVRKARFIASVRNAVVHGDTPMIRDRAGFEQAVSDVTTYLRDLPLAGSVAAASPVQATSNPRRRTEVHDNPNRRFMVLIVLVACLAAALLALLQLGS